MMKRLYVTEETHELYKEISKVKQQDLMVVSDIIVKEYLRNHPEILEAINKTPKNVRRQNNNKTKTRS